MLLEITKLTKKLKKFFEKTFLFRRIDKAAEDFEQQFWSGVSLQNLYRRVNSGRPDPMSGVFIAAMREFARVMD